MRLTIASEPHHLVSETKKIQLQHLRPPIGALAHFTQSGLKGSVRDGGKEEGRGGGEEREIP